MYSKSNMTPPHPGRSSFLSHSPTQTEVCGGYDSFELYKLAPECLTPVEAYEQVRLHVNSTTSLLSFPLIRLHSCLDKTSASSTYIRSS